MLLSQNKVALVDDADFDWLNQWKWYADRSEETFYAVRNVQLPGGKRTRIKMHRLVLGLEHGDPRQGDHINHDGLDNRRDNLRIVTHQQNQWNRRSPRGYNYDRSGAVRAHIRINGHLVHLGKFESPVAAHQAYLAAKSVYHQIP
jgi:hypothetical protein